MRINFGKTLHASVCCAGKLSQSYLIIIIIGQSRNRLAIHTLNVGSTLKLGGCSLGVNQKDPTQTYSASSLYLSLFLFQ